MISSKDLYLGKFNGKELEKSLLESKDANYVAQNLNFIGLGIVAVI